VVDYKETDSRPGRFAAVGRRGSTVAFSSPQHAPPPPAPETRGRLDGLGRAVAGGVRGDITSRLLRRRVFSDWFRSTRHRGRKHVLRSTDGMHASQGLAGGEAAGVILHVVSMLV
jgi:hypothetical protein